jgi:hypothetical protein
LHAPKIKNITGKTVLGVDKLLPSKSVLKVVNYEECN